MNFDVALYLDQDVLPGGAGLLKRINCSGNSLPWLAVSTSAVLPQLITVAARIYNLTAIETDGATVTCVNPRYRQQRYRLGCIGSSHVLAILKHQFSAVTSFSILMAFSVGDSTVRISEE